jgi:hypothetical protein
VSTTAAGTTYRTWFRADAVVTGANAILYLALHRLLPDLLGGAPGLYVAAGAILAAVTLGLSVVAASASRPEVLPEGLAVINVVWALGSFAVAIGNPFGLTTAGVVWAAAQGAVVLAFAALQLRTLRSAW